jgi:hypothetical protein
MNHGTLLVLGLYDLFLVSLTNVPRAVNPGLFVATVNRSGGMSDCGRAYVTLY